MVRTEEMLGGVSGAIIAGGTSARLGTDKRLVALDGVPLLQRTAKVLRPLVAELLVVLARSEDRTLVTRTVGDDAVVVFDTREDLGPAAGLEAALGAARRDLVLVVATDHPALSVDVLTLLIDRARGSKAGAVALSGPRGGEPFVAVYRRDRLGTVRSLLDAGTRRMQDVLAGLGPELIPETEWRALDRDGRTIDDIDTPEDLQRFT